MLLKPLIQRVNSVYLRGSNSHLITAPIDALANRGCFFLYVPPLLNRETVSDLTRRTPANSSLGLLCSCAHFCLAWLGLSAYKVFLQAPVAFRFFNPCPPFFSSHRLFCSQQHIIYIEATHISTLPAHFFTRNRGGLPGSGATFDASLSSFHAATHFFRLYRSFYTRSWLLHQRISRIFAFLSRGEAFFIASETTFSHETKPFLS